MTVGTIFYLNMTSMYVDLKCLLDIDYVLETIIFILLKAPLLETSIVVLKTKKKSN